MPLAGYVSDRVVQRSAEQQQLLEPVEPRGEPTTALLEWAATREQGEKEGREGGESRYAAPVRTIHMTGGGWAAEVPLPPPASPRAPPAALSADTDMSAELVRWHMAEELTRWQTASVVARRPDSILGSVDRFLASDLAHDFIDS
jgi:hypothetical protein